MKGTDRVRILATPLSYLLTAAGAFFLAALSVPFLADELAGHFYHPYLLALTHTVTLGWITMTIMGASFHLLPMVLERRIWSERLAALQFWLMAVGIAGMVGHFAISGWSGFLWAAGLVALGVLCYLVNMAMSLRPLPRRSATLQLLVLALAGLLATLVFGLLLALNRNWPFLPGQLFGTLYAHFHLAWLGWVSSMILGVAARLLPIFLMAGEPKGWETGAQVWGLALGVPGLTLGLLAESRLLPIASIALAAAAGAFVAQTLGMVRRRRRAQLDWGLRFVLTGATLLAPTAGLGLGFAFGLIGSPNLATAYAVLGLGGFTSLTIAGMLLKIVPLLAWYRVYGDRVGREQVPTPDQLSSPSAERLSYWLLTGGVIGLSVAVATASAPGIRLAGLVLAAGAAIFSATLFRTALRPAATRTP